MKKILLLIVLLSLSIVVLYLTNILPVTVYRSKPVFYVKNKASDSIVKPLEGVVGESIDKVYIRIASSDLNMLPDEVSKKKLLYTEDSHLVKQLIDNFSFGCTDSDMSTCESCIYFYSNNKLIFESNIVIESDKIGLQYGNYGWIEAIEKDKLIDILKDFSPIYYPIVFL